MGVSIDVLCGRLGLDKVISKSEYASITDQPASFELMVKWYEMEWLSSAKAIAPIVSERLAGAESVLELGFGTGLRLLYYALNNPSTRFVAVDHVPDLGMVLEDRLRKLRIKNIQVETGDMHEISGMYSVVLGIDCFQSGGALVPINEELRPKYLHFGGMVDKSKTPAFFCTPFYDIPYQVEWGEDKQRVVSSIGKEAGLPRFETVPFSYVHSDGKPRNGRLMFMMPEWKANVFI
jgi:hypothetical protein